LIFFESFADLEDVNTLDILNTMYMTRKSVRCIPSLSPCVSLLAASIDEGVRLLCVRHRGTSTDLPLSSDNVLTTPVTIELVQSKTNLKKEQVEKVVSSVENVGFNSVGQMYRKSSPQGLNYSDVRSILEYFEGINGIEAGRLVRNSPFVLGLSRSLLRDFDENRRHVEGLLGLSDANMGKILSANAYIITRPVGATVRPCVEYLNTTLGFSIDEVRSIVLRFPRILLLSRGKFEDIQVAIKSMMHLDDSDFAKMVWKFPPLVGLSVSKLQAAKDWLIARGISENSQLRTVAIKFPQLLSHDLEAKIDPIINYIVDELGLPVDVIRTALLTAPDTFGRSLQTIKANVSALKSLGMSDIDMARYITSFPGGLRIDVSKDPYKAKLRFLENQLGQKPVSVLPVHPRFLSYSLSRIRSRAIYLQAKERSTNGVTGWLSAKEDAFVERFARSTMSDYVDFQSRLNATN
jgi:hypothetical protein